VKRGREEAKKALAAVEQVIRELDWMSIFSSET
jgi:hypothetical protein